MFMSKKRRIGLSLLTLMLLSAGTLFEGNIREAVASERESHVSWAQFAANAPRTAAASEAGVKVETRTLTKSLPGASIKAEYPQISGLKSKSVQRKLNSFFKARAEAFVKKSVQEMKQTGPSPSGHEYEFLSNYFVTYNKNGILSLYEQTYAYTGGAHGNSYREGLTFRLEDGKLLTLDELLRANPNYRQIVDPAIAQQLQQTQGYFGNFKTIGPNPSYYVKDEGVVIFFPLYEYLPYVNGFPEFYFPFSQLLPAGTDPFDFTRQP
ncbi:DUF3298 and DUF4163 domain-containing protein [Paenibacillus lentus]|uniref:DUF3298/DUF4163 domain-containing protein n=1 Tax=Paenibacillus lentus TaxID=1338368 RepID=A0A3S8RRF0_9BACL|nr:DUF3298 and DUF4163 domain-containing protein [Paenibacillus lentus]AZK45427.1 DUF3298/DUF4163 domain-containing protein [Paenibacillus lentus]